MKMDSSEAVSCVVCVGEKEKESLSKCFISGFNTLMAEADALGLNDLSSRVNQRWECGKPMIHHSCRLSLKHLLRKKKKQETSK